MGRVFSCSGLDLVYVLDEPSWVVLAQLGDLVVDHVNLLRLTQPFQHERSTALWVSNDGEMEQPGNVGSNLPPFISVNQCIERRN